MGTSRFFLRRVADIYEIFRLGILPEGHIWKLFVSLFVIILMRVEAAPVYQYALVLLMLLFVGAHNRDELSRRTPGEKKPP